MILYNILLVPINLEGKIRIFKYLPINGTWKILELFGCVWLCLVCLHFSGENTYTFWHVFLLCIFIGLR